jgi:hypothetical protein
MDDSDKLEVVASSSVRAELCYGDTIAEFHVGRVKVVQRYACIRRDQFEWTSLIPFPPEFRDYLAHRGPIRGSGSLYILDVIHAFQLTVAPNVGRAVFVPRLATELDWQRKVVVEIVSALDGILSLV